MPLSSYVKANSAVSPHAMVFPPSIKITSRSIRPQWIEEAPPGEPYLRPKSFTFPMSWLTRNIPGMRLKNRAATVQFWRFRFYEREILLE
jgi:hypothetical protein